MQYTYLGRTGVKISRLCLGCMSYGSAKWRQWVLEEDAAMPFFRKAVEAGINFFDTADMYSVGASEEITGKALRKYAKLEQIVLATKVFNRMAEGPNMEGLSRKHIQQGCEASLRRLGAETIDLYARKLYDNPADIEVARVCQAVAERRGVQPAQVAIAWLLSKPAVTAPIIGATKIEHLEAALAAVELKLADEDVRQLEAPYQPHDMRI